MKYLVDMQLILIAIATMSTTTSSGSSNRDLQEFYRNRIKTTRPTCGQEVFSIFDSRLKTSCYTSLENDGNVLLEDIVLPNNAIFFIDSSCKGGLNVREACHVEAVARLNPKRQVNVLFTGPVPPLCLEQEPLVNLEVFQNVYLYRILIKDFSNGTSLSKLLEMSAINASRFPVLYTLDILKFLTLYKYNGVYLDLDVLATRPFRQLPSNGNWFAVEEHAGGKLSSAVMSLTANAAGRQLITNIIKLMAEAASADQASWSAVESDVIRGAVELLCGKVPFAATKARFSFKCQGLVLYAQQFFFPVPCAASKEYFRGPLGLRNISRAFTQQTCSSFTFHEEITAGSPYASLMREFCPSVYEYQQFAWQTQTNGAHTNRKHHDDDDDDESDEDDRDEPDDNI